MNINGAKLLYKSVLLDSSQKVSLTKYLRNRFKDVQFWMGDTEYTAIEHSSGNIEHIFTFRSPMGDTPILERIRINSANNTTSRTFYKKTKDSLTKNDCLRTTTYKYAGNNQPEITTRTVDIVPNSKDVTIAESLITQGEHGSNITSAITEKSSGKINKQLKRTTEYSKDEQILADNVENIGLTEQEIKNTQKYFNLDEYFHGRFMDMKSFIQKFRKTILKNQKVSSDLPMEPTWMLRLTNSSAMYLDDKKKIIISDSSKEFLERNISQMIANLNHEARHAWQYELVEKLNKGQLTNPEEIKLAETFKKNIENYISPQKAKTYEEYTTQPIEADAFNAGNSSNINYDISSLYLSDIFKKASRRTLGG